jgi:hypothetical protein
MTTLTTEEVLKMAEEVGLGFVVDRHWMCHDELEDFAKLVADKSASIEREACAKVCESYMEIFPDFGEYCKGGINGLTSAAEAIRARGITQV